MFSDKSCRENEKTCFTFSNFSRKSCRLRDRCPKWQRTNMVYARIMLVSKATSAREHARARALTHARMSTLLPTRGHTEICNTYCFSTATVVM